MKWDHKEMDHLRKMMHVEHMITEMSSQIKMGHTAHTYRDTLTNIQITRLVLVPLSDAQKTHPWIMCKHSKQNISSRSKNRVEVVQLKCLQETINWNVHYTQWQTGPLRALRMAWWMVGYSWICYWRITYMLFNIYSIYMSYKVG